MIEYSDYSGRQDDVVVRDGQIVPFDRAAAREMAEHAHRLATGGARPKADPSDTKVPSQDCSDLTVA